MDNNYNSIPIPPFSISEFVNKETQDFINGFLLPRNYYLADDSKITDFLYTLHEDEHKIQALCKIINKCIEDLANHRLPNKATGKLGCKKENCDYEEHSKKTLYILYGCIKRYNIHPFVDTFTSQEIFSNNKKLDEIIITLEILKTGQEIIFDELDILVIDKVKRSIEEAKELQVLGKQKWQTFILGMGIQLATQAVITRIYSSHLSTHFENLVTYVNQLN